jgi:hypothetical protein
MASKGLGSDADTNRLSTIAVNTWKLPDISSLHNVIRTGIDFDRSDANLFSPRIPSTIGPQTKPEASQGQRPSPVVRPPSSKKMVELSGIEPLTPCLQSRCSPS